MNLRLPLVLSCALLAAACARDEPAGSDAVASVAPRAAAGAPADGMRATLAQAIAAHRFANAPDRGGLMSYPQQRVVRRDGAYTFHRVDLSEAHARAAVGGELTVPLPSGEQLRFRFNRQAAHASGDWTWVGSLSGDPSQRAIITFGVKAAFGLIDRPGEEPLRLTIRDGRTWLVETDRQRLAMIVNSATRPSGRDYLIPPRMAGAAAASQPTAAAAPSVGAAAATASNTVDLVVGYTTGLASSLGGDSQAVTRMNLLAEITNEAYANSQIEARVRIVHTVKVSYADATSNETALEELTGHTGTSQTTPNAAFSALRSARDQYGADLVTLVRKFNDPENDGCGIAWINGGGNAGRINTSEAFFGYSVVSDGEDRDTNGSTYFCRQETFAHELGHNMGAQHDRGTADDNGNNVVDTDEMGVFPYALGYKTSSTNGNFYTIMAYGESGQTRYRVFSNPRITTCGGRACGVDNQADNARALTQTIPQVAAFRAMVVPLPAPIVPRKLMPRDVDGNAREDLVWYQSNTREVYHWFMNGGTPFNGGTGGYGPAGMTPRAVSDFSGEGYADVLFSNGTNVTMYSGNGAGGYSVASVGGHPVGYGLLAADDTNADGRADVIWINTVTGALLHWQMNGATVQSSVAAGSVIGGTGALAVGDTSGDGRAEILLGSAEHLYMLVPTGSGYNGVYVAPRPVGWNLLGMRDADADGKADVFWYHPGTREVYVWFMNGSAPVNGRGGSYVLHGTQPIGLRDFDGNGRVDIMLSSGSNAYVMMATTTTGYTTSYMAAYPYGWTPI